MNFHIKAEYSKLFGKTAPILQETMSGNLDPSLLVVLSMISYTDRSQQINKHLKNILNLSEEGKRIISTVKINKRPSNLILWTELLKNSFDVFNLLDFDFDNSLKKITEHLTIINENEKDDGDINQYLLKNTLYFYQDNYAFQFYRSFNIFIKNNIMKKYADEFENINKISLKDFILISNLINLTYEQTKEWHKANSWILHIESFSKYSNISLDNIKKFMNIVSFNKEDINKFSESEDYKNHNFNFFNNKPFYKISEGLFIPVDGKLSQNLIFNNIYYRLLKSSNNSKVFMSDFGKAFEQYVSHLVSFVEKKSKNYKYEMLEEFEFGNPKKKSSDAYIVFKDKTINKKIVLVVEVKSARILDNFKRLGDDNASLDKTIQKLIINPLKQQIKVTREIIKSSEHLEITKDKFYYFMSVSMENFPQQFENVNLDINDEDLTDIKCAGLNALNIETFELFCKAISSNSPRSLSYIIENHRNQYSSLSFKTYLLRFIDRNGYKNTAMDNMINDAYKSLYHQT